MNKRMVLVVSIQGIDAWLSVNGLMVGLIPAETMLEVPVHEYLIDGANQFKLFARVQSNVLALDEINVSLQLQLRHGLSFTKENGRQTILHKTKSIPKGTQLVVEPLLSVEHHIQVAFPRWHCFSSLSCAKVNQDLELAETFLKSLAYKFLLKDIEEICRLFAHRNLELSVAYGLEATESNARFRQAIQKVICSLAQEDQAVLTERPVMLRMGQSSVFYPVNKQGQPALSFKLNDSDKSHFIPMHLAVHEQQVFIVR